MKITLNDDLEANLEGTGVPGAAASGGQNGWWLAPSKLLFRTATHLSYAEFAWFDRCGDAIGRLLSHTSYFGEVQRPRLRTRLEMASNRPGRVVARAELATNSMLTLCEGALTATGIIGLIIVLPTVALAAAFTSVAVGAMAGVLALPAVPGIILGRLTRAKRAASPGAGPPGAPYRLSPFEGEDGQAVNITGTWDLSHTPGTKTGRLDAGTGNTVHYERKQNLTTTAAPGRSNENSGRTLT